MKLYFRYAVLLTFISCVMSQNKLSIVEALAYDWLGGHEGVSGTNYRVKLSYIPLGFEPLYFWIGGVKLKAEQKENPNFVYAYHQNTNRHIFIKESQGDAIMQETQAKQEDISEKYRGKNVLVFQTKNSGIQYIEILKFKKTDTRFYQ